MSSREKEDYISPKSEAFAYYSTFLLAISDPVFNSPFNEGEDWTNIP